MRLEPPVERIASIRCSHSGEPLFPISLGFLCCAMQGEPVPSLGSSCSLQNERMGPPAAKTQALPQLAGVSRGGGGLGGGPA